MTVTHVSRMLAFLTCLLVTGDLKAENFSYIEPAMVRIEGATFVIGSEDYEDSQPLKPVTLPNFYVGKYEVTIKEFGYFAAETQFPLPDTCYHQIGYWWFENETTGSWSNNDINSDPYEPVTCIGYEAAKAYTQWLAKKTGKPYRLLSEAEWEFLATRGQPAVRPSVCHYANVADLRAESFAQTVLHTSYVNLIGIEHCDDKSGTVSRVGSYQPNEFGIYDLMGNVNEFVEDCYQESYDNMASNGTATLDEQCDAVVLRGGAWHWPLWDEKIRDAKPKDWVGVLEGFRIALDDSGQERGKVASAEYFERQLKKAQGNNNVNLVPELPSRVRELRLSEQGDVAVLQWQPLPQAGVSYAIFANDHINGRYQRVATVSSPYFEHKRLHSHRYQYRVAATVNGISDRGGSDKISQGANKSDDKTLERTKSGNEVMGAYSEPVATTYTPHTLPAKFEAEHFVDMQNALVFAVSDNNAITTGPRDGKGETGFTYAVTSPVTSWFEVQLVGQASTPVEFNIALDGPAVGKVTLSSESEAIFPVSMALGEHELTITTQQVGWQLDAVTITAQASP